MVQVLIYLRLHISLQKIMSQSQVKSLSRIQLKSLGPIPKTIRIVDFGHRSDLFWILPQHARKLMSRLLIFNPVRICGIQDFPLKSLPANVSNLTWLCTNQAHKFCPNLFSGSKGRFGLMYNPLNSPGPSTVHRLDPQAQCLSLGFRFHLPSFLLPLPELLELLVIVLLFLGHLGVLGLGTVAL